MPGEPVVARTAWSKGGTTYVTIHLNGAVRTRVACSDGRGGWTITIPGRGEIAVILPAVLGAEPTEGRLAARTTMGARLAATDAAPRPSRRTWQDLPSTSATPRVPRDGTVFSQALKTIRARPDGATLDEIKESFREIDLYHHDPLTLLRWQHDNRGWGFKMHPSTGRVTLWGWDGQQHETPEPPTITFSPPPPPAPRNDSQSGVEADIERRRLAAQAEWQRIEEERRHLERERRELEEQRRMLAASSTPVPAPSPPSEQDLPAWLRALSIPDRYVFQHLAEHGSINETEATRILGGARQFRRFSLQIEEHLSRVPFRVRIEMSGDLKCYVRERGTE